MGETLSSIPGTLTWKDMDADTQRIDGHEAAEGHQGMSATFRRLIKTGHILCKAFQGSGLLLQLEFEPQALRTMRI